MVCMFWVQTNACIRCIVWYQVPTTIARYTCYRHDTSFGAWLEVPVVVKCPFSVWLSVLSVNRFRSCWFVDLMSHEWLQRDLGEGARGRSKTWLKTYRHKTIMNTKEHKISSKAVINETFRRLFDICLEIIIDTVYWVFNDWSVGGGK